MYIAMILVGGIPAIATSIYLRFFILRVLSSFINITTVIKIVVTIAAVLLALPAVNFLGLYAVLYYYFLAACAVFGLISHFVPAGIFRGLLQSGLLSVVAVCLIMGYGYYNMHHVVETDYTIKSNKINNLKILLISDLHTDQVFNPRQINGLVQKMNKVNPDLVVLDGDIFDENTPKKDMLAATKALSQLHNKLGIYYVYGNHDDSKYGNWHTANRSHANASDIKQAMKKNHITVLDDEIKKIEKVTLVGRRDASYERKSSAELLKQVDRHQYIIVLDHQPLDIQVNAKNGADLELSGHTHGGQIWPTGYLNDFMPGSMRYGNKTIGSFQAITTSGLAGWGFPIKTGAPSEYVVINVK